jgi:hypothetical protein
MTTDNINRNGIKPGQLIFLATYAYVLVKACERDWISASRLSKLGAAIVGVLSMGMSPLSLLVWGVLKDSHGFTTFISLFLRFGEMGRGQESLGLAQIRYQGCHQDGRPQSSARLVLY